MTILRAARSELTRPGIYGKITNVEVGASPDAKILHGPKGLLAEVPFFKTAMEAVWTYNHEKNTIDLTDEDLATFEASVAWLHSRKMPASKKLWYHTVFDLYYLVRS
jgi:hypothetical protein